MTNSDDGNVSNGDNENTQDDPSVFDKKQNHVKSFDDNTSFSSDGKNYNRSMNK